MNQSETENNMTIAEASMGILLDRNVPVSRDWMRQVR